MAIVITIFANFRLKYYFRKAQLLLQVFTVITIARKANTNIIS